MRYDNLSNGNRFSRVNADEKDSVAQGTVRNTDEAASERIGGEIIFPA